MQSNRNLIKMHLPQVGSTTVSLPVPPSPNLPMARRSWWWQTRWWRRRMRIMRPEAKTANLIKSQLFTVHDELQPTTVAHVPVNHNIASRPHEPLMFSCVGAKLHHNSFMAGNSTDRKSTFTKPPPKRLQCCLKLSIKRHGLLVS